MAEYFSVIYRAGNATHLHAMVPCRPVIQHHCVGNCESKYCIGAVQQVIAPRSLGQATWCAFTVWLRLSYVTYG